MHACLIYHGQIIRISNLKLSILVVFIIIIMVFLSNTTKILYYIVSFFKVRVCIIRINRVLNLLISLVAVLLNYIIPIFFVEFELWMFGFFF